MSVKRKKDKPFRIHIDPSGILGMLRFATSDKARDKVIKAAPIKEITAEFAINKHAKALHPDRLPLRVADIVDLPGTGAKKLLLVSENGAPLPYFRAGQYLSLRLTIGKSSVTRAYSICSSPEISRHGVYVIAVRGSEEGFVSKYLTTQLKVGDRLLASSPQGQFYYEPVRDGRSIVAIAGGSGITPFLSMAHAIVDGVEQCSLTILYGSRTRENILFEQELADLVARCDRLKVVHVLSGEQREGYEHGFISADLIAKYAPAGDYSVFLCGPEAMYQYEAEELKKLGLPARRIRSELQSVAHQVQTRLDYPKDAAGKTFRLTLHRWGETYELTCTAEETVLVAIERSGIVVPSRCRNGSCGWCRSRLLQGNVYVPEESEARRYGDMAHGYIHPCCSYPISDLELEVSGE